MTSKPTVEQVDSLLPQTQCGLCGYGGCIPYAKALVREGAAINLCPPGGIDTLQQLAIMLDQDATPFMAEMAQKQKPQRVAIIREAECIGCTKCIQACPVDAIFGSAKQMHTVIADECTGCELCIAPCPVDCIDMQTLTNQQPTTVAEKNHRRSRFQSHQDRLQLSSSTQPPREANKQDYLQAALIRAKKK